MTSTIRRIFTLSIRGEKRLWILAATSFAVIWGLEPLFGC